MGQVTMSTELAAVLLDCLAYPPARANGYASCALVPWEIIHRGRELFAAEFPNVDVDAIRRDWRGREKRARTAQREARIARQ